MSPSPLDNHERFSRLVEVGQDVLSELDLEGVLRRVAEAAREVTGARYAALGVLNETGESLGRFIHVGIDEETRAVIGDLPRGRGVLGELIRTPEPLRLKDVGEHPHSYGFPAGHPPMASFVGVPIAIRGKAFGNLYITEKIGAEEFTAGDEEALVVLAGWAAIAIENARLYTDVASRQEQLQRALRQVETTLAITKAVGGETNLERVLELIVKRARALVEAQALVVFLVRGESLEVAATVGRGRNELRALRQPLEGSAVGAVVQSREPATLDGPESDGLRAGVGAEVALLVPLVFRGECLGVLAAFDRVVGGPGFDADDLRLLQSFATSAATAVATAQNVQQSRLRERVDAAERERHHWAHELHDEALQQLAAIRLELASALRSASSPEPSADPVHEAARRTVDRLEEEIDNLSRLINELRPVPLETLGLKRAVESLAAETASQAGIDVDASIDVEDDLPPDTERTVYRLFQESLTNIVKHAGADSAQLEAVQTNGELTLRVTDDGSGFDTTARSSGVGLRGMRERVEVLGGTFAISSEPGSGTEMTARLPTGA